MEASRRIEDDFAFKGQYSEGMQVRDIASIKNTMDHQGPLTEPKVIQAFKKSRYKDISIWYVLVTLTITLTYWCLTKDTLTCRRYGKT